MSSHLFRDANESRTEIGTLKAPISADTRNSLSLFNIEGDKPGEYLKPSTPSGYTELPIALPEGGVVGGNLLTGVTPGKIYRPNELGDFVPVGDNPIAIDMGTKQEIKSQKKKKVTKLGKEIQQVIETATDVMENVEMKQELPTVKVTLNGQFGKFTGTYVSVVKEGNLVVLIQKDSDDGFVPPVNEDTPLKIVIHSSTASADYDVYYLGLSFAAPVYNAKFFIYHLVE